ncbi:hypothetical protein ES705_18740 [subsurface metagenome]
MPITLENTRITVEFQGGDPKGDSWVNPFTLDDIVAASDAGSWDPAVIKNGRQIYIPYSVYIQGADTYFQAEDRQVCFDGDTADDFMLYIYDDVNFRSRKGYEIMSWHDVRGAGKYTRFGNNSSIENSSFSNIYIVDFYGGSAKTTMFVDCAVIRCSHSWAMVFDDIIILNGHDGIVPYRDFLSCKRLKIIDGRSGMLLTVNLDLNNLYIADCTYSYMAAPKGADRILNITDSAIDETLYLIYTWYAGSMTVNFKSTFKINIADGDGGTAKLYDKYDNLVFSEVLSGELEKSVTYYDHYIETEVDNVLADDKTTYEPFRLVVLKSGYMDLTIPNIVINYGSVTHIFGKMVVPIYYQHSISGSVSKQEISGKVEVIFGIVRSIEVNGTIDN